MPIVNLNEDDSFFFESARLRKVERCQTPPITNLRPAGGPEKQGSIRIDEVSIPAQNEEEVTAGHEDDDSGSGYDFMEKSIESLASLSEMVGNASLFRQARCNSIEDDTLSLGSKSGNKRQTASTKGSESPMILSPDQAWMLHSSFNDMQKQISDLKLLQQRTQKERDDLQQEVIDLKCQLASAKGINDEIELANRVLKAEIDAFKKEKKDQDSATTTEDSVSSAPPILTDINVSRKMQSVILDPKTLPIAKPIPEKEVYPPFSNRLTMKISPMYFLGGLRRRAIARNQLTNRKEDADVIPEELDTPTHDEEKYRVNIPSSHPEDADGSRRESVASTDSNDGKHEETNTVRRGTMFTMNSVGNMLHADTQPKPPQIAVASNASFHWGKNTMKNMFRKQYSGMIDNHSAPDDGNTDSHVHEPESN